MKILKNISNIQENNHKTAKDFKTIYREEKLSKPYTIWHFLIK